ncbi:UNVERIFIED_CONTAM: Endo-1,4-beta-xylanase 5 [Sesamum radiatum]|uniref:Endo-1,4-beta-xylanase 5 n=1 Tax=Sesamum radiatum TaxID=300843 RepID=A0AAW2RUU8_SESRA
MFNSDYYVSSRKHEKLSIHFVLGLSLQFGPSTTASASFTGDGPLYDYSAYTECKSAPEDPLYGGGIIKNQSVGVYKGLIPQISCWVKITAGAASAVIKASLTTDNVTFNCMGTVIAKRGCWSFLKGGFVLDSFNLCPYLFPDGQSISISVSSASLQPFTDQQWKINQQNAKHCMDLESWTENTNFYYKTSILTLAKTMQERKRTATLHVSDIDGNRLQGATVVVEQVSRDFPFGSSIASTILGNLPYQNWFVERFNAAVFENELKWIQSLMSQYRNEFIHWDVDNEMLHWDFYEQRLGPNASLEFFQTAQKSDPLARLFMNEYNVLETCDDMNSTVDRYISRLQELREGGVSMDGIGLEGHFTVPNPPLIRAVLDKLAMLKLPIWLTEVDISNSLDQETQAKYLEVVLREGFSHPSVKGIMLWTALHPSGCYRMCLTDNNFHNLPAGDVVDSLLKEWETEVVKGETDDHGAFDFSGFLGEYRVTVNYGNRTTNSTFSLCPDDETKHWNIHL